MNRMYMWRKQHHGKRYNLTIAYDIIPVQEGTSIKSCIKYTFDVVTPHQPNSGKRSISKKDSFDNAVDKYNRGIYRELLLNLNLENQWRKRDYAEYAILTDMENVIGELSFSESQMYGLSDLICSRKYKINLNLFNNLVRNII